MQPLGFCEVTLRGEVLDSRAPWRDRYAALWRAFETSCLFLQEEAGFLFSQPGWFRVG